MPTDSTNVINKLDSSSSLLDIMISVEDYLDSLDLFVFDNWIDGEIVDGPNVSRYWIRFSVKYPYKDMPDPQGGLRLLKYGSKISFERATEKVPTDVKSVDDLDPETRRPKMIKKPIWIVHFKIPRRFIEDLDISNLDIFNDDNDVEQDHTAEETEIAAEPTEEPTQEPNNGTNEISTADEELEI